MVTEPRSFVLPDGRLDTERLLSEFAASGASTATSSPVVSRFEQARTAAERAVTVLRA